MIFTSRNEMLLWMAVLVLAIACVVFLGGCSTTPEAPVLTLDKPLPDEVGPVTAPPAPPPVTTTPTRAPQPVVRRGELYFDTNSAEVRPIYTPALRKLARFLRNHPANSVLLEGNCDERGTFAYNQRLGAARADSAAKVLIDSGVTPGQIVTGSNGKFKPLLKCHTEQCWSMNRRVDLIYGW